MFRSLSHWPAFVRALRPSQVPARPPRRARHRPTLRGRPLEQLEERSVPAVVTFTVTSLADSGVGTLRSAITTADQGAASNSYVINIADIRHDYPGKRPAGPEPEYHPQWSRSEHLDRATGSRRFTPLPHLYGR